MGDAAETAEYANNAQIFDIVDTCPYHSGKIVRLAEPVCRDLFHTTTTDQAHPGFGSRRRIEDS